jgi:large repetitive protein
MLSFLQVGSGSAPTNSSPVAVGDPATVNITVTTAAPNQAPVADLDLAQTSINTSVTFSVIANDSDVDGAIDAATVVILRAPRRGTAVSNGDGAVTYTPGSDFTGTDNFRYRVRDNLGLLSKDPNGKNRTKVRVNVVP